MVIRSVYVIIIVAFISTTGFFFQKKKKELIGVIEHQIGVIEHQQTIIALDQARLGVCMRQIDAEESNFAEQFGMIDGNVSRIDFIMKIDGESRWFVMDIPEKGVIDE